MTTESASVLYSLTTTALIGSFWMIFGRDTRSEVLRRELRLLHVELLQLASNEPYRLSQTDYERLNHLIQKMIGNAHRMTATRLVLASLLLQHRRQETPWDACYKPIRDRLLFAVAVHAFLFKSTTRWLTLDLVESALNTVEC